MQHQPLGGNLHHHRITACVRHHPKIFLYQIGLGRSVLRMDMRLSGYDFYGADQPHLPPSLLQNGLHQIGGGGFALRARNAYDLQLPCGVAEERRRDKGQRIVHILHADHRHIRPFRQFHLMLREQCRRPGTHRIRRKLMAVRFSPRYADKQAARCHLSGIIDNICYFLFCRAAHALVRYFL